MFFFWSSVIIFIYLKLKNKYHKINNSVYLQFDEQLTSCIIKSHVTKQVAVNIPNKKGIIKWNSHGIFII